MTSSRSKVPLGLVRFTAPMLLAFDLGCWKAAVAIPVAAQGGQARGSTARRDPFEQLDAPRLEIDRVLQHGD
jgi:hypothetical protein